MPKWLLSRADFHVRHGAGVRQFIEVAQKIAGEMSTKLPTNCSDRHYSIRKPSAALVGTRRPTIALAKEGSTASLIVLCETGPFPFSVSDGQRGLAGVLASRISPARNAAATMSKALQN
jgi:hypothetical protein